MAKDQTNLNMKHPCITRAHARTSIIYQNLLPYLPINLHSSASASLSHSPNRRGGSLLRCHSQHHRIHKISLPLSCMQTSPTHTCSPTLHCCSIVLPVSLSVCQYTRLSQFLCDCLCWWVTLSVCLAVSASDNSHLLSHISWLLMKGILRHREGWEEWQERVWLCSNWARKAAGLLYSHFKIEWYWYLFIVQEWWWCTCGH